MSGRGINPGLVVAAPDALVAIRSHTLALDPVEAAHGDDAADVAQRQFVGRKIAPVGGEQRREIGTGGVADDKHLIGVAAVVGDVLLHPGERRGRILDMHRVLNVGREAIVGNRRRNAGGRKALSDERLAFLVARGQSAAIQRHDDGHALHVLRQIELVLFGGRTHLDLVGNVGHDAHRHLVGGAGHRRRTREHAKEDDRLHSNTPSRRAATGKLYRARHGLSQSIDVASPAASLMRQLSLSVFLVATLVPQLAAQPLSPRNANYTITAKLDAAAHTITGSEVITWRNIASRPAADLQFHLYWNAWKHERTTFMRERLLGRGGSPEPARAGDRSRIDVTSFRLTAPSPADLTAPIARASTSRR